MAGGFPLQLRKYFFRGRREMEGEEREIGDTERGQVRVKKTE